MPVDCNLFCKLLNTYQQHFCHISVRTCIRSKHNHVALTSLRVLNLHAPFSPSTTHTALTTPPTHQLANTMECETNCEKTSDNASPTAECSEKEFMCLSCALLVCRRACEFFLRKYGCQKLDETKNNTKKWIKTGWPAKTH